MQSQHEHVINTKIFDGEFYSNVALFVFKTPENVKKYDIYIICDKKIPLPKISKVQYIDDLKAYIKKNNKLIGFNNQTFDNQILQKVLMTNPSAETIYKYSQELIAQKRGKLEYRDHHLSFSYLDLLKINNYDNPSRATSLKKLEFNYRLKKIADLPFHHSKQITTTVQIEQIIKYCIEDTIVTETCFEKTKPLIVFRQELTKEVSKTFPSFQCMNLSDTAIGEELNLLTYCKETGLDYREVKYNIPKYDMLEIFFKDCIPEFVSFKSPILQKLLVDLKSTRVSGTKEFKKKFKFGDLIITMGQGGLHTEDPARIIKASSTHKLIDADISGQYPLEIIKRKLYPRHLGPEWYINAERRYRERLALKPLVKTSSKIKAKSDALKLQLNAGLYGKTNSKFSWQYDPLVTMKTTLGCQTAILMLVEDLIINEFTVISINTDGIVTLVDKNREQTFYNILNTWNILVKNVDIGGFEFTEYEFIAQTSVNDYIAKLIHGDIKRKGLFLIYEDLKQNMWHKDGSAKIISEALEKYFIHNIPVDETIRNCQSIYEFCYGAKKQKAPKKGEFSWLISEIVNNTVINTIIQDRYIRYYIGGNTTINKLYDDGEIKNLPTKENPVTLAQYLRKNNIPENLNIDFYINEAQQIINSIEKSIHNL